MQMDNMFFLPTKILRLYNKCVYHPMHHAGSKDTTHTHTHTHIHFFLLKTKTFPSHSNFQTISCCPIFSCFCLLPPKPTKPTNQTHPLTTTTGVPKPGPVDLTSSSSFSQRLAGRPKRFVKASSKVSTSKANTSQMPGRGSRVRVRDGKPKKNPRKSL